MQAETASQIPDWLAIGTPDRRIRHLPEQLEALLRGTLTGRTGCRWTMPTEAEYLEHLPTLTEVCAELADTPVPDALDHADLHGTNVFVDGPEAWMADWGDACITHPFSSLFVPYAFVVGPRSPRPSSAPPRPCAGRTAYLAAGDRGRTPPRLRPGQMDRVL